jgi:hypothetical protein
MKKQLLFLFLFFTASKLLAQGTFSGDLMMNVNFFNKDTNIKASGNPLYDNALSGSDGWLTMRYAINGFAFFVRADAFNNSNLKNPVSPNTDFGIGAWNITKELDDLTISVGSIYDQIGSGILFRAYEDRGLLIDNALMGFELKYKFGDNFTMKGFTGQVKNNNSDNNLINNVRYGPVLKGFNAEGDYSAGNVHLNTGFGAINRTLDEKSMQGVAAFINAQDTGSRFLPRYNMYAFSLYNTLTYKNLSWFAEGAYKTHEAIAITNLYDPLVGKYADRAGNIVYTSINYGRKGVALSLTGKRTQDFTMRTSPNETVLKGMLNWQPIVAVLRPLRLMSRYSPPSQDQSEMAGTANMNISPNDVTTFTLTYTHINTLTNQKLLREAYCEAIYQGLDQWVLEGGVQYLEYNLDAYQNRAIPFLTLYGVTPFVEVTYKITDNRSVRFEAQYMNAANDYGSWAFALLEYNIAPKWSFTLSDMYNAVPNKGVDNLNYKDPGNHYYSAFTAYTKGSNRFTLAYVKQVDGINCSGGVCRYEPAFSGVKATITSSF